MLLAIIYGLTTALVWGTGDFLSRKPSKEIGYLLTTAYVQPFGLIVLLVYAVSVGQLNGGILVSNPTYLIANFLIGITIFVSLLFLVRGYSVGVMSIVAPIAGAYPAVTFLLSVVILGVVLSTITTLAITLTMVGIVLAGLKLSEILNFVRRKPAPQPTGFSTAPISLEETSQSLKPGFETEMEKRWIVGADSGLIACLCGGTALFGLGFVSTVLGPVMPTIVIKAAGLVTGFLLVIALRKRFTMPSRSTLFWLVMMGALDALGFVTLELGILQAGNDLPIVVTLSALLSVVTSMLATIFYKERMEKVQALGIVLIIVGVATIVYF